MIEQEKKKLKKVRSPYSRASMMSTQISSNGRRLIPSQSHKTLQRGNTMKKMELDNKIFQNVVNTQVRKEKQ